VALSGGTAPALWLDVPSLEAGDVAAWRDWYDRTYLAARAGVEGVVAARRCVGLVGSVGDMALYDLADAGVPFSPAWQAAEQRVTVREAREPSLACHREATTSYLLRQISSSVTEPYQPPGTEILHMAFFVVEPPHQDEFNDWYELEHARAILQVPGYRNIRRFQGVEDGRIFVALYDVDSLEVADGQTAAEAMRSRWSDRIRAKLVTYRERRLFRVERRLPVAAGPATPG
jgi:hypothetical protein